MSNRASCKAVATRSLKGIGIFVKDTLLIVVIYMTLEKLLGQNSTQRNDIKTPTNDSS